MFYITALYLSLHQKRSVLPPIPRRLGLAGKLYTMERRESGNPGRLSRIVFSRPASITTGLVRHLRRDCKMVKNYCRCFKGSTCSFSLEGVPASCLTGIEYEKVVGLAVLSGYTKMGCEGHVQFVNALFFSSQGRGDHTALVIDSWSSCAEEVTSSGKSMVAYSDSIAS